ncbi:Uncharacterized conserved protein, contains ParB-like and HNH nuclease domains [Xylanibacter ruminicola]|uniref:Uncharacterized conserved protein, contains ParB-like and HNH nuclease domains n=1 Tax=Xylanibacter ruminicola TaxID=839 RepID=A0A1H4B121_XYLRU|nr:DUF262 domain-containing protein [Xylanibacter ruminicola]SEA41592.1 Uncharacterized conserved protein, contains ParB-like and HNH nuclease domains [Xylanibacter ruminicola]
MKDLNNILEECSINDIYFTNRGISIIYKIPIYQRNYAWEREEIYALIKDVYDSLKKSVYYIGTLVTYKRDENIFEVIDGQQRLTTIYIILKALGIETIPNTLTYSARKVSAVTIEKMPKFGEEKDLGIVDGFNYAKEALKDIVGEKNDEIDTFKDFFLNKVHIIHYRVPKDVDLNHYFEVMNSRGEQLEKHEIVKAKLSEQLIGDDNAMQKFSRIWEACSDMSFYIQQKLPDMTSVFGKTMESFDIESFDEFPSSDVDTSSSLGMKTISEFLNSPIKKIDKDDVIDNNDHFQPIIDFPNFLLIVLKITRLKDEKDFNPLSFTLDDKELIKEFEKVNLTPEFVKDFAYNLLSAKYFLDNYVIHHANGEDRVIENPWKLQYYYKKGNKAAYLKDLYEGNKARQNEVIQLLSMFEVSFTPKQRKNYLFYCLLHLFEDWDLDNYLEFLRKLADKYFFDVYLDASKLNEINQPKPNSFDETILNGGELNVELEDVDRCFDSVYPVGSCNIPLYVFNYTDYKLWKKYAEELRSNKEKKGSRNRIEFFSALGCSDFELEPFKNFYFSRTRKSLEHYYPQAKAGDNMPISSQDINCFGNFAMIGSDANSSGSNWNPIDKKNRYLDTKSNQVSVASLKFRIMLQICQDNYDAGVINEYLKRPFGLEWNVDDMVRHQEKMLEIIMNI